MNLKFIYYEPEDNLKKSMLNNFHKIKLTQSEIRQMHQFLVVKIIHIAFR